MRAAVTLRPDVVVMDINMPELDGVAASREIREAVPGLGILVLTMLGDDESVHAAIAAGAAGYVLNGDSQDTIVRAIHAVAAGESLLTGAVARQVLDPDRSPGAVPPPDPFPQLTPREQQVLGLLAGGRATADIARKLGIATKTVNNSLSTIFTKLGVTNRTEAALLAQRAGLIR